MRYTLQSGILTAESSGQILAKIKSSVVGPGKTICGSDDGLMLKIHICPRNVQSGRAGDVCDKAYIMEDASGKRMMEGWPEYSAAGPIRTLPRINHAVIAAEGETYCLTMHNCQYYSMRDAAGQELLSILHRGIVGGWNLEDRKGFAPEILCGIFAFCRYLEQENEFLVI